MFLTPTLLVTTAAILDQSPYDTNDNPFEFASTGRRPGRNASGAWVWIGSPRIPKRYPVKGLNRVIGYEILSLAVLVAIASTSRGNVFDARGRHK